MYEIPHIPRHIMYRSEYSEKKNGRNTCTCVNYFETLCKKKEITAVVQWVCQKLATQHSLKNCYCCHYHCWKNCFNFHTFHSVFRLRDWASLFLSSSALLLYFFLYDEREIFFIYFNFIFICLEANERLLKTFQK